MVSWFIILSAATTERSAKVMDTITISNIIVTVMLNDLYVTQQIETSHNILGTSRLKAAAIPQ